MAAADKGSGVLTRHTVGQLLSCGVEAHGVGSILSRHTGQAAGTGMKKDPGHKS